jgi:hypothetical protein
MDATKRQRRNSPDRTRLARPLALAGGSLASLAVVVLLLAPSVSASHVSPFFIRTSPFPGVGMSSSSSVSNASETKILVPNAFNVSNGLGATASRSSFVNSPITPVTSWTFNSVMLNWTVPPMWSGTHNVTIVWHFGYDFSLFASRNHCVSTCFQGIASIHGSVWGDVTSLQGASMVVAGAKNASFVNQSIVATHNTSAVLIGEKDQMVLTLSFSVSTLRGSTYMLYTGYWVETTATYGAATFDMGAKADDHSRLVSFTIA